jgi:hypothetical protein
LGSTSFQLVRFLLRTPRVFLFLLLLFFVFDEFLLLLQNFEFLLVAGLLRDFQLGFVQL